MTTRAGGAVREAGAREVPLERLLGRRVLAPNNRPVGRLEEFQAEPRGSRCVVTGFVIGPAGLLERLGVGLGLLFGPSAGGYVARPDQIDLDDPERPRLTCPLTDLRRI